MSAVDRWAVLVEEVNGRRGYYSQHVRDPEFPCDGYERADLLDEGVMPIRDCTSDGHYICRARTMGCIHFSAVLFGEARGGDHTDG